MKEEKAKLIREVLSSLNADDRTIILLRIMKMTYAEIARVTGLSETVVRSGFTGPDLSTGAGMNREEVTAGHVITEIGYWSICGKIPRTPVEKHLEECMECRALVEGIWRKGRSWTYRRPVMKGRMRN